MGFLSSLSGALKEGVRQGIAQGINNALIRSSLANYNFLQSVPSEASVDAGTLTRDYYKNSWNGLHGSIMPVNPGNIIDEDAADKNTHQKMSTRTTINTPKFGIVDNETPDIINFDIPDWTYADWINERSLWQKQITSIFDEPGYFYFKIFFKFNTQHGLLGGLLNNTSFLNSINSAAKYLYISKNLYRQERPLERITALFKFASLLSYINTCAPWYFKGIKGLDECNKPILDKFSEEKSIEIEVTQDAIDMRLSTLMSLYKFACYDDMNCKEILPDNLRKFDMTVIVFAAPIRHIHTAMIHKKPDIHTKFENDIEDNNDILSPIGQRTSSIWRAINEKAITATKFDYKSLSPLNGNGIDWSNVMSYKMYTFQNCEFDISSLGRYMPNSISNEEPFKMGNSTIKINYDRVYEHQMNEFYGIMFGSDGIYYNQYASWQWNIENKDYNVAGRSDIINRTVTENQQEQRYKAMADMYEFGNTENTGIVEAAESLIHDRLKNVKSSYAMGNIYGESSMIAYGYDSNGKPKLTEYYKAKLKHLKNRLAVLNSTGGNILLNMLKSSYSSNDHFGNLYGDTGIGSQYWRDKLKRLKTGSNKLTDVEEYRRNERSYNSFSLRDYLFQESRKKK